MVLFYFFAHGVATEHITIPKFSNKCHQQTRPFSFYTQSKKREFNPLQIHEIHKCAYFSFVGKIQLQKYRAN